QQWRCAVEGCTEPKGNYVLLCPKHYHEQWRENRTGSLCSYPGCDKVAIARGFCPMHYRRLRVHGDPSYERVFPETCTFPGCDRPWVANGFCGKHNYHWKTYGDPTPREVVRYSLSRP